MNGPLSSAALLLVVLVIGCGGSTATPPSDQASPENPQPRTPAAQVDAPPASPGADATGQQSDSSVPSALRRDAVTRNVAPAVTFERLQALLPALNGWTQADARGEQLSMPTTYSRAEAVYHQGDSRIELEITDTAASQLLLAPLSMFMASGFAERSSDGFKQASKVSGHPGFEEWNAQAQDGEVTTIVSNRFIVTARGRRVSDISSVRNAVEAIDFAKLGALK